MLVASVVIRGFGDRYQAAAGSRLGGHVVWWVVSIVVVVA